MSLKSKKLFLDGRTDGCTYEHFRSTLLGLLRRVNLIMRCNNKDESLPAEAGKNSSAAASTVCSPALSAQSSRLSSRGGDAGFKPSTPSPVATTASSVSSTNVVEQTSPPSEAAAFGVNEVSNVLGSSLMLVRTSTLASLSGVETAGDKLTDAASELSADSRLDAPGTKISISPSSACITQS